MLLNYFRLLILLKISLAFTQKSYEFDTLLKYECRFNTNISDTTTTQYIYTNSKDNSYSILVREDNSLYYSISFIDFKNYSSKVPVLKSELFNATEINITNCRDVFNFTNKYKYKTKHYDFINLKDTLINNEILPAYKLVYLKGEKRKRRRKVGSSKYIIKKNTQYHLPILRYSTAFNEWNLEKNIPNGIYQEFIIKNYNGKIVNHYKLQEITKINLTLNVVEPCPMTITIRR